MARASGKKFMQMMELLLRKPRSQEERQLEGLAWDRMVRQRSLVSYRAAHCSCHLLGLMVSALVINNLFKDPSILWLAGFGLPLYLIVTIVFAAMPQRRCTGDAFIFVMLVMRFVQNLQLMTEI